MNNLNDLLYIRDDLSHVVVKLPQVLVKIGEFKYKLYNRKLIRDLFDPNFKIMGKIYRR